MNPSSLRRDAEPIDRNSQASEAALPNFLPTPSEDGVRRFRELYQQRLGHALSDEQALDLATRYLHLYFFGTTRPKSEAPLNLEQTALPSGSPFSNSNIHR